MDRRRLTYLERLGIPVYVPRDAGVADVLELEPEAPPPEAKAQATPEAGPETVETPGGAPVADHPPPPLDWEALRGEVAGCQRCRLCQGRTQTVFGVGDPRADLVVVGEGPGREEDRRGEPFVGPAGQLLDEMLLAIGRGRERGGVYIANVVKCRPPGNREPRSDEVAECAGYLRAQLALIQPRVVVAVGRVAAQSLLGSAEPLARLRQRVHSFPMGHHGAGEEAATVPLWVTYHPAYLLRSPADKAKAWQDLKRIRAALEPPAPAADPA